MRFEYAPAPESRSVVTLRDSYGLFIGGEFAGGNPDKIRHSRGENRKFRCHAVFF